MECPIFPAMYPYLSTAAAIMISILQIMKYVTAAHYSAYYTPARHICASVHLTMEDLEQEKNVLVESKHKSTYLST